MLSCVSSSIVPVLIPATDKVEVRETEPPFVLSVDTCGLVVVSETYIAENLDTGTVVMLTADKAMFIVVHRDGPSSYYPVHNYGIPKIRKLTCGH